MSTTLLETLSSLPETIFLALMSFWKLRGSMERYQGLFIFQPTRFTDKHHWESQGKLYLKNLRLVMKLVHYHHLILILQQKQQRKTWFKLIASRFNYQSLYLEATMFMALVKVFFAVLSFLWLILFCVQLSRMLISL